jgi:hypothetical protein
MEVKNKGEIIRRCKNEKIQKIRKTGLLIFIAGCFGTIFWSMLYAFVTYDDIIFILAMIFLSGIQLIFLGLAIFSSGYRPMIIYSNGVESSFYLFFKEIGSRSSFYLFEEIEQVKFEPETKTTYSSIDIFLKDGKKLSKIVNDKSDYEKVKELMKST